MASRFGLGRDSGVSRTVRKSGSGSRSTGGSGRKKYPTGVSVALASAFNCLKVGLDVPLSHSASLEKRGVSAASGIPARSRAQAEQIGAYLGAKHGYVHRQEGESYH